MKMPALFRRAETPVPQPYSAEDNWKIGEPLVVPPLIDRAWAKELGQRVAFTPDAHIFNRTVYQRYFAYGVDMESHYMYERLIQPHCMNNGPLADVFTEQEFTMVKKKLGYATYPIVTDLKLWNVPQLKIRGQLFALRSYMIPELDKCYENTVQFNRQRIKVTVPHHVVMFSSKTGEHRMVNGAYVTYDAWAYIAPADHWKDQIDAGYLFGNVNVTDPNNHSQLSQYYHFTHVEYKHE